MVFSNMIDFIDRLFYTTTITTQIKKTTKIFLPDDDVKAESSNDFDEVIIDHFEQFVRFDQDQLSVGSKVFKIPDVVKNRDALFIDNRPNLGSFPNYRNNPIIMSITHREDEKLVHKFFVNEYKLSRGVNLYGYDKTGVEFKFLDCENEVKSAHNNDTVNDILSANSDLNDVGLCVDLSSRWVVVKVVDEYTTIKLFHYNESFVDNDRECVIAAFAYSRAILLNTLCNDIKINIVSEDDLAIMFLALFSNLNQQ